MSKKDEQQVFSAVIEGDRLGYCCGVHETGAYASKVYNRIENPFWSSEPVDLLKEEPDQYFESLKAAWQDALNDQRSDAGSRPIVFTFVKYKGNKTFNEQELHNLVAEQPDHLFVHGFTNPGSGNYVEMWVLTNGSK